MDFWGTVTVLFRRWRISVLALISALFLLAAGYVATPTLYTSTATLVLTSPQSLPMPFSEITGKTNPLLNFDRGLNLAASLLISALNTPEVFTELGASPDGDPTFTIDNGNPDPTALVGSPFLFITGRSSSPGKARALVDRVEHRAIEELARRQRQLKVSQYAFVGVGVVSEAGRARPDRAKKLRSGVLALGFGIGLGVIGVFAFESAAHDLRPRRPRRDEMASAA